MVKNDSFILECCYVLCYLHLHVNICLLVNWFMNVMLLDQQPEPVTRNILNLRHRIDAVFYLITFLSSALPVSSAFFPSYP